VKRRFQDAGLLDRVAMKKTSHWPIKIKRLRRAKEHRHWTEELCLVGQHPGVDSSLLTWIYLTTINMTSKCRKSDFPLAEHCLQLALIIV
jgi:hypothetical protein